MVSQVKVVSILMIINGLLNCLFGLTFAVLGQLFPFLIALDKTTPKKPEDKFAMTLVAIIYGAFGAVLLIIGLLNVIAGARTLKFRGRTFALVALFLNILPIMSCYCALTSLGMMIYGLIVFFNNDVARAFSMVDRGVSVTRVLRRFAPSYAEPNDDEDV